MPSGAAGAEPARVLRGVPARAVRRRADPLLLTAVALCAFALLSGFVDAVAGGGGLIQVPALLVLLPGAPVATVFGTNKLASMFGTGTATARYARHVSIPWRAALPAAVAAFVGSWFGAQLVRHLRADLVRPLVLGLLIAVALFTALRPHYGTRHEPRLRGAAELFGALALGGGLGFYDGFFGPGAGSFLIFLFIGLFGFDFLSASASSKVVNFGSGLAALLYFASTRHVLYGYGFAMAVCSMLGSALGTRFAVHHGVRVVRPFFLGVVSLLILRLAWDTLR